MPTFVVGDYTLTSSAISGTAYTANFNLNISNVLSGPVATNPEPSTIALLGTGLIGVAGAIRKRFV